MLVVAYQLNELLVGNYEVERGEGIGVSGAIVIAITAIFTIGNIVWLIF
jgi:hypothetical protein